MTATETLIELAEANAERQHTNGVGTVRTTYFWTNAEGDEVKVVVSRTAARTRYDSDRVQAAAYVQRTRNGRVYTPSIDSWSDHSWNEWERVSAADFIA